MEVPHLTLFVRENSLDDGAVKIVKFFRPGWDLSETRFKVFTDGITNKLLGCFNDRHDHDVILVRVYGNKTDLLIDRKRETETIVRLNAVGLAPALYGTFDNGLVYEYVPGTVLTTGSCRVQPVMGLVARRMADMHAAGDVAFDGAPSETREPVLWKTLAKFLGHLPDRFTDEHKNKRFRDLFPAMPDLRGEYLFIKRHLEAIDSAVVFCHNDLLLGNVIHNPDNCTVTFIDYEYAGFNYQAYDIANHFNEFAGVDDVDYSLFPDVELQRTWLRAYLERYKWNVAGDGAGPVEPDEVDALQRAVERFTLASHLLWGVWSLLQAEYSTNDFDYLKYASIRLTEYYVGKERLFSC